MRSAVIALVVFVSISRSDFLLPFQLSDDLINYTAQLEQPINNETVCPLAQLNYCQYSFNMNFGLDTSVSYNNGTAIFNTIQSFMSMNVMELNRVCKARTNFYHCLGHSYYTCMNLHTRLQSNTTDSSNGFDYVRTFRTLEWVCGGGYRATFNLPQTVFCFSINPIQFPETINQFDCFGSVPTTTAYQNCMTSFNQTVSTNNFCTAIQQNSNCLKSAYQHHCEDSYAGLFGCESFRYTFSKACPTLKCTM